MKLFDPNDTVMILLDHQTGLLAVAVLIERLRRPPPATPTLRMRYRGSTKELAR